MNNASGQIHHGVVDEGAAGAAGAAGASPCPVVTEEAEARRRFVRGERRAGRQQGGCDDQYQDYRSLITM
jgi:hypothetical protein